MSVRLFFFALLLGGCGFYGCVTQPDLEESPSVLIINKSGRQIIEILHRPCGEAVWHPIENTLIMPGGVLSITLSDDCEDLLATFKGEENAGLQKDVRRGIPLKWVLY